MTELMFDTIENGGVASACGFSAGGIHAGFRDDPNRLDMALVEADELCPAAGVFTQNVFCAAPVTVSREHLEGRGFGLARALVVNSGIANAATGTIGLENARLTAEIVAQHIGCAQEDVLVASTGVIGQQLDITPFKTGVPALHEELKRTGSTNESGHKAACAIMTTDTVPKEYAISYTSADPAFEGCVFTVGGMAKGSGMIMPNMATMISVLTSDAPVPAELLHEALLEAVGKSFNKVRLMVIRQLMIPVCFLLLERQRKVEINLPLPKKALPMLNLRRHFVKSLSILHVQWRVMVKGLPY